MDEIGQTTLRSTRADFAASPLWGRSFDHNPANDRCLRAADVSSDVKRTFPIAKEDLAVGGKAAVVGVVSTGQVSRKPDEEYLPELD
jgi:hypothetical protein